MFKSKRRLGLMLSCIMLEGVSIAIEFALENSEAEKLLNNKKI